jgi:hypothetical protein
VSARSNFFTADTTVMPPRLAFFTADMTSSCPQWRKSVELKRGMNTHDTANLVRALVIVNCRFFHCRTCRQTLCQ